MTNLSILLTNTTTSDWWLESLKMAVPGVFTVGGICLAAFLTYRFYLKQKHKEIAIQLLQSKYNRKLEALEQCWQLLAYTTDSENQKSILVWEELENKKKKYFVVKANAEAFMQQVPNMFYDSGLGLYLTKEIKEQLFQYSGSMFGFLLKEQNNANDKIEVRNPKLIKKLIAVHQELGRLLRLEKDTIEEDIL